MAYDDGNEPLWSSRRCDGNEPARQCELPPWAAGAVLASLHAHGIPFRIETDGPRFVWVLVKHTREVAPRVLADHLLDGASVLKQNPEAARATDQAQFLLPDWIERGTGPTLEAATQALATAVATWQLPFAEWWKKFLVDSKSSGE